MTLALYWAFLAVENNTEDDKHKLKYLSVLIRELPEENIYLMGKLFRMLKRVSENQVITCVTCK
jgi:hypothetical protein